MIAISPNNNLLWKVITYHVDEIDMQWGEGGGGGVMIFVKDIPCREILKVAIETNIEGILLEFSTRKKKWLPFGGYCNKKIKYKQFFRHIRVYH